MHAHSGSRNHRAGRRAPRAWVDSSGHYRFIYIYTGYQCGPGNIPYYILNSTIFLNSTILLLHGIIVPTISEIVRYYIRLVPYYLI